MSTQTLSEWARGATPEQKCKLLWTLANLAEQSMPVGCDPSEIAVEDADPSRVHVTSSGSETNLAWWPPEAVSPTSDAGTNLELSRSLFTLGLLGYWLFTGRDYLQERGISSFDLAPYLQGRTSLIEHESVIDTPCASTLMFWTSTDPAKRNQGTIELHDVVDLQQAGSEPERVVYASQLQGPDSTAALNVTEFMNVSGDSDIKSLNLRMADPDCVLSVMEVVGGNVTGLVKSITVRKPEGYVGTDYVLTVYYDSERKSLYARCSDPQGRLLSAEDLGVVW